MSEQEKEAPAHNGAEDDENIVRLEQHKRNTDRSKSKAQVEWEKAGPFPVGLNLDWLKVAVFRATECKTNAGAAMVYAKFGVPVFPCREVSAIIGGKKRKAKSPYLGEGGLYLATTDPAQVEQWWGQWPGALVGVPMGRRVGFWALDIDTAESHGADGFAAWDELTRTNRDTLTRVHETGNGGNHRFYKWNPDYPVGCRLGGLPKGMEVKGEGGYVIFPPSRYEVEGRCLEYSIVSDHVPEKAPAWLYDIILGARGREKRAQSNTVWDADWVAKRLETICEGVRTSVQHGWDTSTRPVYYFGQEVGGGAMNVEEAREAVLEAAEANPTAPPDFVDKVERAFDKGVQDPVGPTAEAKGKGKSKGVGLDKVCSYVAKYVEQGLDLYYDTFEEDYRIDANPFPDLHVIANHIDSNVIESMQMKIIREHKVNVSGNQVELALHDVGRKRQRNRAYERIMATAWDGVSRLEGFWPKYFGAPDTPLNRWFGTASWIAMVRRVRDPGEQWDHIGILSGEQGIGKSTMLRIMVGDEYYVEFAILGEPHQKIVLEQTKRAMLVDDSELLGLQSVRFQEIAKGNVTRREDVAREAYGRGTSYRKRRFIIMSTSNRAVMLRDPSGNRRYIIIKCSGTLDFERLRADRGQLLAEAAVLDLQGFSLAMPGGLRAQAKEEAEEHRVHHPWEDALVELEFSDPTEEQYVVDGKEYRIASQDILDKVLEVPKERQSLAHTNLLAEIMPLLGWKGPKTVRFKRRPVGKGYTKILRFVTQETLFPGGTETGV